VKRDAELARVEAEKKKKEEQEREKEQSTTQSPTDGVIEVSMTSGATEVATPNPNRELDLGL